jgi:TrmH family RNA methyltransferase
VVADRLLESASALEAPDGVLALAIRPTPGLPAPCESMVLLENLQDPGNVGSIIRTCAAGGVQAVQLSAACADPWSPKALRAGMGGQFATVVCERVDLPAAAAAFGGQVVAAAPEAPTSLFDLDLTRPTAFIIGSEGSGISPDLQALASERVRLPMPGAVDSLNAAAAAAVCVFERVRQLGERARGGR